MSQAKGMAELDDAQGSAAEAGYQSLSPWATLARERMESVGPVGPVVT